MNDDKIVLYIEDLSTESLRCIKSDLEKYAHLRLYGATYERLARAVSEREKAAEAAKLQDEALAQMGR